MASRRDRDTDDDYYQNYDREMARRRRRKEMRRRKRRRARIRRMIILVVAVIALLASVIVIAKNAVQGTLFKDGAVSAEVSGSTISESGLSSGISSDDNTDTENQPVVNPNGTGATPSNGVEKPWVYTTTEAMPAGDIVDWHIEKYSYDIMCRDLYFLESRYGDYMKVMSFGKSLDDRDLLEVVIGPDTAEKDIIIQYSMHAREYHITNMAMGQLEYIMQNYETGTLNGESYKDIFSKVRVHMIPMMNPDGVTISQFGFNGIRNQELVNDLMKVFDSDLVLGKASPDINEYTATWKANARSVDLNRNFDTPGWTTEMGTRQPSCSRYPGASANSEPEVQALIALTNAINCKAQIAYHSHGRIIYCDYGMEAEDPALYQKDMELANMISSMTRTSEQEGYSVISTVKDGQNPGGCSDYYMQVLHIPALTVEVGDLYKPDGSYNDPPLSADQVDKMLRENREIIQAVAQKVSTQS